MPTFDLLLPPQPYSRWRRTRPARLPLLLRPLAAAWRLIVRSIDRSNQRRALAEMEDHMLRDIGITRVEAAREAGKWFWR